MIFAHFNFNVLSIEKSEAFYAQAFGFSEVSRIEKETFTIAFLGDGKTGFKLELTEIHGREEKYDLGECEFHLAVEAEDYDAVYKKHKEMGIICFENPEMGIYFVTDPDGYWIEVVPKR